MYRRQRTNQMTIEDFMLPFGGKLKADNQWIKLAELMPWDEIYIINNINASPA